MTLVARPRRTPARFLARALAPVVLVAGLSAGLLAGCSGDAEPAGAPRVEPTPSARPALRPGDPVPAPKGKVVLVVRGGTVHNVGRTLQLDLAQLEAMGTVSYEVDDSEATGRVATFSGPLMRTVLAVAGASGTTMHATALNDYVVDVPVSDARDLPLMLATRVDGRKMSVANYGPTRFVYPTEGYDLPKSVYDPRWIWQLREITVT